MRFRAGRSSIVVFNDRQMNELNLWLDNYDDIFSDFDARALQKRRVSEDFVHELEMAYRRKEENTELLVILVPAAVRNETDEKLIMERLANYFNREYDLAIALLRNKTTRNIIFLCISVLVMTLTMIIEMRKAKGIHVFEQIRVLLEPAGWFFFWNSLEYFFYQRQADSTKVKFWHSVASWRILFRSY